MRPMTAASSREATVAQAAPATPISGTPKPPKTNQTSRTMLSRLAPTISAMGNMLLPAARMAPVTVSSRNIVTVPRLMICQVVRGGRNDVAGGPQRDADLLGVEVRAARRRRTPSTTVSRIPCSAAEVRLIAVAEPVVAGDQRDHRVHDPVEDDHRDRVDERRDRDGRDRRPPASPYLATMKRSTRLKSAVRSMAATSGSPNQAMPLTSGARVISPPPVRGST